jgi:hypothetical protein
LAVPCNLAGQVHDAPFWLDHAMVEGTSKLRPPGRRIEASSHGRLCEA